MTHCVYIWRDPKDGTERYVGWGSSPKRPYEHFENKSKTQLSNMLRKRRREGYELVPEVTAAPSELSAKAMEIFWIAVFGRLDLGTGTLFNLTAGGTGGFSTAARKASLDYWAKHKADKPPPVRLGRTPEIAHATALSAWVTKRERGYKPSPESIAKGHETLGAQGRSDRIKKGWETRKADPEALARAQERRVVKFKATCAARKAANPDSVKPRRSGARRRKEGLE